MLSFGLLLFLVACSHNQRRSPAPTPTAPPRASVLGNKLQLKNFTPPPSNTPVAPPPLASGICTRYTPIDGTPPSCKCSEVPTCDYGTQQKIPCQFDTQICNQLGSYPNAPWCVLPQNPETQRCYDDLLAGRCKLWCAAKPVIYLYPERALLASVALAIAGRITVSDPLYPIGGWKDVLAFPDGTVVYESKKYPYLYYETEVAKPSFPKEGIIVPIDMLEPMLTVITTQLGLTTNEQNDFLSYWLPRLKKEVTTPLLLISLVTPKEKELLDKITVQPKPDTTIELLFQFIPLKRPIDIQPLALPKTPPKREGFVMVEWGGGVGELVQ